MRLAWAGKFAGGQLVGRCLHNRQRRDGVHVALPTKGGPNVQSWGLCGEAAVQVAARAWHALLSMSPKDDLFFTHEAEFEVEFEVPADGAIGESVLREAWVFRHLGSLQCFHTQTGKNRRFVDEQILKAESVLGRKRTQKQANERRQLLKRGF